MNFWERNNGYNMQGGNADRDRFDGGANGQNAYRNSQSAGGNGGTGAEQDIRDRVEQYSGKSEDQLMSELTAMSARMKKEGSFDPAAVENLYNTASPFLNEQQRQRMRAIVDMLKG